MSNLELIRELCKLCEEQRRILRQVAEVLGAGPLREAADSLERRYCAIIGGGEDPDKERFPKIGEKGERIWK